MTDTNEVVNDLLCTRCGYNLRGLAGDGRCPECNTPIARSNQGNLLRFADPGWLGTLRLGMTVKLWTIVVSFLGGVALGILTQVLSLPQVFLSLFGLAASGLGLWAAFLITAQEPRISIIEDSVSLRRVVRSCAVLSMFAQVLQQAGEVAPNGVTLFFIGMALGTVTSVVSYFGEFVYLRRFARRVPSDQLVRSTTKVMWGLVITMTAVGVGALVAGILSLAAGGASVAATAGVIVGGIMACSAGVALLVFALWYIRLLLQYRDVFEAAATESRMGSAEAYPGPARPITPDGPA